MADAILEVLKLVGTFGAGFGTQWLRAKYSAEAKAVRATLDGLDELVNRAENSARAIMAATPNVPLACEVITSRTHLGTLIDRTMKSWDDYAPIPDAMGLLARTMAVADPADGNAVTEDRIAEMRTAQQRLRQAIMNCAEQRWSWKLFRHDGTGKGG